MKKVLSFLLAMVMVLSTSFVVTTVYAGENDFISIASASDFAKIGVDAEYPLSGNYRVTRDFTITDANYQPIGTYAAPFTGAFDGNGMTITVDLTYTKADTTATITDCAYVGLFGCIESASITDLTVVGTMNVNTVCGYIGGIIGCSYGVASFTGLVSDIDMTIILNDYRDSTCYVSYIGGVIGMIHPDPEAIDYTDVSVSSCANYGNIDVTSMVEKSGNHGVNAYHAAAKGGYGGIVGATSVSVAGFYVNLTVTGCVNYGDITVNRGGQNIGGIVGLTYAGAKGKANISYCANYGNLTRNLTYGDRVAAIIGYIGEGPVTYCFNAGILNNYVNYDAGDTTAKETRMVGFYGKGTKANSYVAHCFSLTKLTSFAYMDDIVRVAISKYEENYATSDTGITTKTEGDVTNTNATNMDVASTDALSDILSAFYANISASFIERIAFARLVSETADPKDGNVLGFLYDTHTKIVSPAEIGITCIGYQVTDVDAVANTYHIRFVSWIDSLEYDMAGYTIVASYTEGGVGKTKTFSGEKTRCNIVYTSLTGSVSGNTVAYSVVGDGYLVVLAVSGIPADVGTVTFTVTPYTEINEVQTPGAAVVIEYDPSA